MSQLARMLDCYTDTSQDRERKLVKLQRYVEIDRGKPESDRVRKLLEGEAVESDTLIQEEVHRTIMEGAEPVICMRDVLPVINVKTNSMRYVTSGTSGYAEEVSEGAEIPIYNSSFTKVDFTIKKVGVRPVITKELVEDGLFNVVEHELRKAGRRVENKLNRDALTVLISTDHQVSNCSVDDKAHPYDLTRAWTKLASADYMADKVVMHPEYVGSLMEDSNFLYASYAGDTGALRQGTVGSPLLGMKPYTLGITVSNASWDFSGTAGDVGAIVVDSGNAGAIAMRQDIKVEDYEDVIHGLVGMSVTMRYDAQSLNGSATVKISNA